MIDQEALEEEPIGALIREAADNYAHTWQRDQWALHLRQIADEADRREREWRRLYASIKEQNDALAREVHRGLRSINDKLDILEESALKRQIKVHIDPPKKPSALERVRELGERAWYR